jgi:hypothetical protein
MNDYTSQNGEVADNLLVAPIGDVPGITFSAITISQVTVPAKDFNDVAKILRGRAEMSHDRKAVFIEGSAAKPAVFEPEKIANELRVWWEDASGDKYLIEQGPNENPIWRTYNETKLVKLMRSRYVRLKAREDETLGEIDQVLLHIMERRCVDLVLEALPGYKCGIHDNNGKRILVKSSPHLIEPRQGEWPIVKRLIDGRLNLEPDGGPDQTAYFHGWCKAALESLLAGPGNFRPGQCCIFAGPLCSEAGAQIQVRICSAGRILTANGSRASIYSWRIQRPQRSQRIE